MRLLPHRGAEHELHLLAAGEALDAVVRAKLGVEAEVDEVLLDVRLREGAGVEARAGSLALVDAVHVLLETELGELLALHPGGGVHGETLPLHLVLVLGLLLATGENLLDDELEDGTILLGDGDLLLHEALLLLGVLGGHLGEVLLVLASLEAPADVLVGSLLEVLLDVVEGVLRDVA